MERDRLAGAGPFFSSPEGRVREGMFASIDVGVVLVPGRLHV